MLVGHKGVIGALSSQLPPVSIITGPPSVGKRMIATYAAIKNNVARIDFTEVSQLSVAEVVRVKQFMKTTPMNLFKFALIDMDSASPAAMNDLLKTLEEPPEYARFSLISSHKLPSTILTRAHKYQVGLLNSDELYAILVAKGLPAHEAKKLSLLGRVDIALATYSDVASKAAAINVLQAVESGDYILFNQAFKAVDEKAARTILAILEESASQTWKIFSAEQVGVFANRNLALKTLNSWSNVSGAKSKLSVRVALESLMKG